MGWTTIKKYRYLLVIGVVLLDQGVKAWVRSSMYVGQSIPVIANVFHLTYVQNTGAAFNILEGHSTLLMTITFAALLLLCIVMDSHRKRHGCLSLALSLIIAGGAGNLLDRMSRGFVTDLFDFRFFPVFNIADISICVGCGFLVLYILLFDREES